MFTGPEIARRAGFCAGGTVYDGTTRSRRSTRTWSFPKFHTVAIPFYAHSGCGRKGGGDVRRLDQRRQRIPALRAGAGGGGQGPGTAIGVFTALDGGALDTSAFSGKVVVVNFWPLGGVAMH